MHLVTVASLFVFFNDPSGSESHAKNVIPVAGIKHNSL